MKNETLLHAMEQVKEEFIEEAAPTEKTMPGKETGKSVQGVEGSEPQERDEKGKSSHGWIKWVVLAACAALVIGIGAPRVFRAINDDTRSFWPEEGDYMLTDDMVTALTTVDTNNSMDTSLPADEGFPDWGLTLSVKDVTNTGLTLVCTKNGGNPTGELTCGTEYHLSVLEDGAWKDVPTVIEEYAWNSLAYHFPEGQDTEFNYTWEWLYGKLPAGTYRLTKGFMDFRGAGDYDTAMYWVEFEITE